MPDMILNSQIKYSAETFAAKTHATAGSKSAPRTGGLAPNAVRAILLVVCLVLLSGGCWKTPAGQESARSTQQAKVPTKQSDTTPEAKERLCVEHAKQLGIALVTYVAEHQNRLPPAAAWCDAIKSYVGSSEQALAIFRCPELAGESCGFAFNSHGQNAPMHYFRHPTETVVLFESDGGWNRAGGIADVASSPRHSHGIVIVFVDSHVQVIKPDRLKTLVWGF